MSEIGEMFQALCRTPEWRAALIVYEKYRRKFGMSHEDLVTLRAMVSRYSNARRLNGHPVSKEFLIQKAAEFCKQLWAK